MPNDYQTANSAEFRLETVGDAPDTVRAIVADEE